MKTSMVSTRNKIQDQRREDPVMEDNNPMTLLLALQCEMAYLRQRNEEDIQALRRENEEMKLKLYDQPSSPLPESEHRTKNIIMSTWSNRTRT